MEKKIDVKENQEVVITFTTSGEEWKKAQNKEFSKRAEKLVVKGFRKGHVPLDMAKKMINPAEVLQDAIFTLVNENYAEIVRAEKFNVFTEPKLAVSKVSEDEMVATVSFCLPPKVTLGEYKGIKIEEKAVRVLKKDVEEFIANLQNEHATMNVKEGKAKLGDTVIIDFKGYIDDSPFDGGEAKAYELKLGSNSFVPGFEEQLVGIKAGESKSIEVTFPSNYVKHLASKVARFDIKCSDVKETVLPKVDQEFIDELNIKDVKTVEDLEKYAKETLKARKEREAHNQHLEAIVNKIVDNATVLIGDGILEAEAQANIDSMKKQVEDNGLTFDDYLSINGTTAEKLMEEKKQEAYRNIKSMLVVEQICHDENIVVTKEILDKRYQELATQYNMKVEDVARALEPNYQNFVQSLRNSMFTQFIEKNNA